MLPTTAPIVDLTIGGKARKLYFGFRAWHSIGVNPLRPSEVSAFASNLNPESAAKFILAGLTAYQALARRLAKEDGEEPPAECSESWDMDRVLDMLDIAAFTQLMEAIGKSEEGAGDAPEGNAPRPMAPAGENSEPSGDTISDSPTPSSGS